MKNSTKNKRYVLQLQKATTIINGTVNVTTDVNLSSSHAQRKPLLKLMVSE